jgi:PAS domain S-box-containing protein
LITRLLSRYALAVVVVALAALFQGLLGTRAGADAPFLLFLGGVLASAGYGGLGPGLLAALASGLVVDVFFQPPARSLAQGGGDGAAALALFLLEGGLISVLAGTLHAARRQCGRLAREQESLRDSERRSRQALKDCERAEDALRGCQERLRLVADGAPLLIHSCDAGGRFQFVNRSYAERLGLTPADLAGRRLPEVVGAEAYHCLEKYVDLALEGRRVEFELEVPYEGVGVRTLHCTYLPQRAEGGSVAGFVGLLSDVTEGKRAQEAAATLAAIVASSQDAIIGQTLNGTISSWNEGARQIFGFTAEEVIGRPLTVLAPPDRSDEMPAILHAVRAGKQVRHFETERVRKDGRRIYVSISVSPIRDSAGHIIGLSKIARDITERKRAEEALHASEERYRRIAETANEGIWLIDADGRTTFANRRMADMLGSTPEEMVGRPVLEFVFEEDRPAARERIGQNLKGRREQFDFRFRRQGGAEVLVLGGTSPVRDGRGDIIGALGMFSDITERKNAERALCESEAHFRHLADAMPQIVSVSRADGRLEYLNRRWHEYTGRSLEESQSKEQLAGVIHPDDLARVYDCWEEALAGGTAYQIEYRLRRAADSAYRWFLGRTVPIHDDQGRVARWFGTSTDIDDQKRTEQALREADRRKDDFLAVLSHELRNPLAPLRNAVHIMRLVPVSDPTLAEARAIMDRQVRLLAAMVDDLLDVFRLTHQKAVLRKEPLDLAELVRLTVADQGAALEGYEDRGSRVEHRKARIENREGVSAQSSIINLEVPAGPVWVVGDRTRLSQVLGNLLGNAAKFSDAAGRVTVRLAVDAARRRAVVSVRDTGIGIAPELLPRVFETFTQGEQSLDRRPGGLGLGLALVKGLVELHGGGVEATSPGPGLGAELSFWLPLPPPREFEDRGSILKDQPESPSRSSRIDPRSSNSGSRGLRVLIVEDNPDAARTLRILLTRFGHEVTVAHTGPAGVEAARRGRPDVILCDLGLPEMDGFDVARMLREDPATAPAQLIAVSGYGQDEDRRRSREAGFDLHLTKPVDPAELQRLLAVPTGVKGQESGVRSQESEPYS